MNADDVPDDEAPLRGELEELRSAYLAVLPREAAGDVAQRAIGALPDMLSMLPHTRSRRRTAVAGLLSLATAAAIVLAVSRRDRAAPTLPAARPGTPADSTPSPIAVEVPEGRNAAVFATRNPLISVVWIY